MHEYMRVYTKPCQRQTYIDLYTKPCQRQTYIDFYTKPCQRQTYIDFYSMNLTSPLLRRCCAQLIIYIVYIVYTATGHGNTYNAHTIIV